MTTLYNNIVLEIDEIVATDTVKMGIQEHTTLVKRLSHLTGQLEVLTMVAKTGGSKR